MYQYRTRFENVVKASLNFESNALLSVASLDSLRSLIPSSVNLDKNVDLVGAAFNAAVVNRFNKNGDGIDTNSAIAFRKYFIHKPTNIEHKKQRVVGHIVNAAFSSYGTNNLLFEDDVKGSLDPFNIALAAVVYKTVDRNFADALVNSDDPESNLYQKISASWEIGFNDYYIAIGSENLKDVEIITKKQQIEEFKKYLKGFDGYGKMDDGTPIYRLVTGRIYPLGIGFTTNPAADVQGVVVDNGETDSAKEDSEAECIEVNSLDLLDLKDNKFSQNNNITVNNNKITSMDLEQILSALKTALAEKQEAVNFSEEAVANISLKIAESIKLKNEEIKAEMAAAELAKVEAVAQADKFRKDLEENNQKLQETLAKLNDLESAISQQAAAEVYSSRMSVLDQEYDFDNSDREILAKELSSLDKSEESFAAYKNKVATLFKHKNKAFKLEQEKAFQDKLEAELAKRMASMKQQEAQASTKTVVEVETALANAKREESVALPAQNIAPTEATLSWKEKVQRAFSKDNVTIKF